MNPRKLPNAEDCKKTLNLLDYLRKSQCTKTIYSTNGFGQPFLAPEKPDACEKTLKLMEEIAKECIEESRYRP